MTLSQKVFNNWEYTLSFILDSAFNGFVAVDNNGYIVVFNEPARNLLGVKDEVAGKHILEIMPESRLPDVIRTGVAELGQRMLVRDRLCLANITPIMKNGEVVGAVLVFEDITLLQKIVEELSSAIEIRETLQTVLDISCEALVVTDRSGIVSLCNKELSSFLQMEKERIIGTSIEELLPEMSLKAVLQSGKPSQLNSRRIRDRDVIVSGLPLYHRDTSVCGAVGRIIFRKVSEIDSLISQINSLKTKLSYYQEQLEKVSGARYKIDNIVGKSQVIVQLKESLRKIANGDLPVLLRGETGTGKKLFAHALHLESPRKYGPFIRVNCSAMPGQVLEAEVFGVSEGVLPGLKKDGYPGKIELADQGTIFFDEIGDMSLDVQEKLVRVLREGAVQRVGSTKPVAVDIRVIAATKRNLEDLIGQNLFREDLYYRLNVISLSIPPLRDRREDVEPLINYFIEKYNNEYGKKIISISSEAYNLLIKHNWPGNVRELDNILDRVFNVIEDQVVQLYHLPVYLKKVSHVPAKFQEKISLKAILEDAERNAVIQALQRTGGNKVKAAKVLGISRAGLYQKLEKYNLLDE